mgnify:FL=1
MGYRNYTKCNFGFRGELLPDLVVIRSSRRYDVDAYRGDKTVKKPELLLLEKKKKRGRTVIGTILATTVKNRIETEEGFVPEALKSVMKDFFEELQLDYIWSSVLSHHLFDLL